MESAMPGIRPVAVVMLFLLFITAGGACAGNDRDALVPVDRIQELATGRSAARASGGGELFSPHFRGAVVAVPGDAGSLDASQRGMLALLPPARVRVGTESLVGLRDSQVRIYPGSFPVRANALVTFTSPKGAEYCTAWFYGPNVLATAGHCIHEGNGGQYYENVTVYPAYDAGIAPYGSYSATNLYAPAGWREDGSDNDDYGFIALGQNVGNTVGYYGVWAKTGSLKGLPAIIAGYPDKKSPAKSLWLSSDIVRISKSKQIFYKNDTYAGQSGSAVWLDRPVSKGLEDGPYAYAIHTSGTTLSPTSTSAYNSATRIDKTVFEGMMMFRDMNSLP